MEITSGQPNVMLGNGDSGSWGRGPMGPMTGDQALECKE